MTGYTPDSRLGDVLENPAARSVLSNALPGLVNSPMLGQLRNMSLRMLADHETALRDDPERSAAFWASLAAIEDTTPPRAEAPAIAPDPDYEGEEVPRGSAELTVPTDARVHGPVEIALRGPAHGNPFVDVELEARVEGPTTSLRVGGFYDGDGRYLLRFLPEEPGTWRLITSSTARSLDGIEGSLEVSAEPAGPGAVRVADRFHFAHADGTRHVPLGTTAYAWTHQGQEVQERTLAALAASPFTKIRMCVFPKAYLYNTEDPERFTFPRAEDGEGFDLTRFDLEYFRHLESRIRDLDALGIQADLILFHPYDRWGFAELGRAADDRYVRYLVRRLAALPNVWWSMANEFDLMWTKSEEDWERLAAIVVAEDPARHLLSIHNCLRFYDYSRPWITHSSTQRIDVYRTAENVTEWREQWGKPVVVDECAYEGDLDQGWGNITGEEMTRRFWEGAVRGGYVGHGETYFREDHEIWWSKGGDLHGTSPDRIAFLARILAEAPGGVLEPLPSEWDTPWAGVAGEHLLLYFGFNRPRFRTVRLPEGRRYTVDVLDTWGMTIERLPETVEGSATIPLPARQFMALRFIAVP